MRQPRVLRDGFLEKLDPLAVARTVSPPCLHRPRVAPALLLASPGCRASAQTHWLRMEGWR